MLTELSDYVNIFLACDAHVQCASGSVVEHLLAKEGAGGFDPRLALFFVLGIKPCKNKENRVLMNACIRERLCFFVFYRAQARDEVDAKASTSYTAQGAVFLH